MASIPLQRSMDKARDEGYQVGIVERFIQFPKPYGHRVDLFNLFDAVAVKAGVTGVLGIQACRDGDVAEHIKKIREGYLDAKGETIPANPYLATWKAAGNRGVIWGWALRCPVGPDGKRQIKKRKVWTCREIEL